MLRRNRPWVVLRLAHDNVWVQVTAVVAPTRKAAIDIATSGPDNPYPFGTFKAIPSKAWAWQDERSDPFLPIGHPTC